MKEIDFTLDDYRATLREKRSGHMRVVGLMILVLMVSTWYVQTVRSGGQAGAQQIMLQRCAIAQAGVIERLDAMQQEVEASRDYQKIVQQVGGGVSVAQILAETARLMPQQMNLQQLRLVKAPRIRPPSGTAGKNNGTNSSRNPGADKQSLAEKYLRSDTRLTLTGWAASGTDIGGFVSRINASELFASVNLRYERPEVVKGRGIVEFMIECVLPEFE